MEKEYIAYYRASNQKQAELFMSKQKDAVAQYLHGLPVVAEYVDIDSSDGSNQPHLLYALEHAQRINGLLVVATRNRLSRHESFFADLKERGIGFVCVDEVGNG